MRASLLSKNTTGVTITITLVLAMMEPTALAQTQNILPNGGGNTENEGQDVEDAQSGRGAILCNDPDWDGEGTCIDPSVPKCGEGVDEVCYTDDGDLKNLENQPYCDEVSDDYSGGCWDRRDYDQETGLYPCKEGYKEDWRDCNGNNDGDEPQEGDVEAGCQAEDDYCDADEGCESESVDCVDDTAVEEGHEYNG
jgi:hypothetical protein